MQVMLLPTSKLALLNIVCIGCFIANTFSLNAQNSFGSDLLPSQKITFQYKKLGPSFGYERGRYNFFEIGGEFRWKKIQLKNSFTQALHAGFNYNFWDNVLGFDAGYWIKPQRIGLTYGADALFKTDFTNSRPGIAPVLGYQFLWLHLQTGYAFYPSRVSTMEINTFFIRLRVMLINERDVKVKNDKKPIFNF
jgi:hypothetical protein